MADGVKFCTHCGIRIGLLCPTCGAPTAADSRFCGECGTALATAGVPAQPTAARAETVVPTAERRLVSVVFADLVGFTTLSETRDAEEVRDLLTRYFEACTTIITRYGGSVEKFIGDAVMAIWGAPAANEDDAERAVRAALDLVAAVAVLGEESGAEGLSARAGVLTGEAAVTIGATGQGMVAGDLVNTASRIQSAAPPGGVLVGEATRYATQAAIAYEDAGEHALKGKAEPLRLHRALRVASMRSGGQRAAGLEAPFVGRTVELRTVRDLMHGTADRSTAHLVSITGIAGIGKSRLSWELEKYVDGLVEQFWWHRGRCLAYGEGVAFSALAEMVRSRALILENEQPASAGGKLAAVVAQHVPDESERRWVEPRLRQLLALDESPSASQEDLFAAWRLFIERMTATSPVVLVFEDMHWADSGLLDFVEYLLDWSRNHPLFIMTLARPELVERRPMWGASRRNVSSLYLEPLPDPAMHDLLAGLGPGLPEPISRAVLTRAAGVPLYAVETVRMMLDRGLLAEDGGEYRATGPLEALEVPETLHALVAARLDTLEPAARRLLGDAAVLGKAFTEEALQAVSGVDPAAVRAAVEVFLRREILERATDPRSPERGHLQFVQDLLQLVAYETLGRRDRREKHLAVADFMERSGGTAGDTIEVVAAHYVEALALMPDDDTAAELRAKARQMLLQAGDRVAALGSWPDAFALFTKALRLSPDAAARGEVHEKLGLAAYFSADLALARSHYEQAITDLSGAGQASTAARVGARLGDVHVAERSYQAGIARMKEAIEVLDRDATGGRDVAALAGQLARVMYLSGSSEDPAPYVERALLVAEQLADTETLSHALNTKSHHLMNEGRHVESRALLEAALDVALRGDHHVAALRAYNNLATLLEELEDDDSLVATLDAAIALARRVGNRFWERTLSAGILPTLIAQGRWDEALVLVEQSIEDLEQGIWSAEIVLAVYIYLACGDPVSAERLIELVGEPDAHEDDQVVTNVFMARSALRRAHGRLDEAVADARAGVTAAGGLRSGYAFVARCELVEALLAAGQLDEAAAEVATMPTANPGERRPGDVARRLFFEGRLAAAGGVEPVTFVAAAEAFRELRRPFLLAVTLLEHAEWMVPNGLGDEAEPLLAEAREIFARLTATPWLERLARAEPHLAPAAAQ
jgi:class 3 adenylate cyclase/tetratricopeptide (TPR) repeat protein